MPKRTPLIRTMFHRRLVLLAVLLAPAYLAIGAQLARLTLVQGASLRAEAESRLVRRTWLPTVRGRIFDRTGRVLAYDKAGYDVRVDYAVLTGSWSDREATKLARRLAGDAWSDLPEDRRRVLVERCRDALGRRIEEMFGRLSTAVGIDRETLDARAVEVVDRVNRMKAAVSESTRKRLTREHVERGLTLDEAARARIERIADRPIAEERESHVVASGVDDTAGFELLRLLEQRAPIVVDMTGLGIAPADDPELDLMPGVEVRNAADRAYPFDELQVEVDLSTMPSPLRRNELTVVDVIGLAEPVLGRVRDGVFAEDVDRRKGALETNAALRQRALTSAGEDRGAYLPGDSVGHTGVEGSLEDELRGLRGERTEQLQTGAITTVPPAPGRDVQLTIDVALQARIRAAMDPSVGLARVQPWHHNESLPVGTHLYGGAVVLDIATGEILALVSTPATPRDGDWSKLGLTADAQVSLFKNVFHPEINRAIAKPYPPGSIAKAAILCGAVQHGVYTLSERIPATGHLLPDRPDLYRSWIYKMFGVTHRDQLGRDPDGVDALMVSANVFFFTLGRRLGQVGITETYNEFGVGDTFGLGIGIEWAGSIGALDGPGDGSDLEPSDAILMGIGQGPVTWTPLHAASAYATIARGGTVIRPRLIRDGSAPEVVREIPIAPATQEAVLEGLSLAVNDLSYGTGCSIRYEDGGERERIFRVPGIRVWGKTGTATSSPIVFDPDGEGPQPKTVFLSGDHSWFVVLVGEEGGPPKYAISVVMDYAGSGGRVSGPITDQIVRALVAEGYLTPAPGAGDQP